MMQRRNAYRNMQFVMSQTL